MAGKILRDDVFEYQKIVDGLTVVTGKLDELGKSIVEIKKAGGTFSFDKLVSSNKKIEQSQSSLKKIEEERIRIQKEIEKVFIKNLAAEEKNYKVLIKGREALKQKNAALREEITGQKAAAKARREAAAAEKQQAAMAKLLIAARNTESGSLSRLNALNNIYKARMKELNVLIPAQAKTYDFLNKKILMNQKAMANMAMGAQRGTKQFNMLQWQIMQVSREMPAFAYGFNVGIGALSNNLPMLFDEIGKVRKANKLLAAEGKATTSVLRQIAKSILSWQTALVAVVTLFTLYSDEIVGFAKELFTGSKAIDANKVAMESLTRAQDDAIESSADELTELKALYDVSQDNKRSLEERTAAVNKLQDTYPSVLSNLSDEEILAGKASTAYDELTNSIRKKAEAEAIAAEMSKVYQNIIKLQTTEATKLSLANKTFAFISAQFLGSATATAVATGKQITQNTQQIQAYEDTLKMLQERFNALDYTFDTDSDGSSGIKKQIKDYERFLPTLQEVYKAHYIALESDARNN